VRRAFAHDIPLLVGLMAEFYAEGGYALDQTCAANAFAALIGDQSQGSAWVIEADHQAVGHAVLTLRFAMEYGGTVAYLDDLYVQPPSRNKGLAAAALAELRKVCEKAGVRAMMVEAGVNNGPAQSVYRRAGFAEAADRRVLALPLAAPAHIA
jgi:GNAT superfamily N-acetyltransferase